MSCQNLKWSNSFRYKIANSGMVPENGGVYKVLRDDGEEGKMTRVYVGRALDLRKRYLEHLSSDEQNTCLKRNLANEVCYFKYALLSGEDNRIAAESHLLKDGSYECNKKEE